MKIFKCCSPSELEHFTRDGWTLEQILNHDKPANVAHTAPAQVVNNNNNQYGYQSGMTVPVDTPVVVREPMFLLWKMLDVESREKQLEGMLKAEMEQHKKDCDQYAILQKSHDTYKSEADLRTKQLGEAAAVQQKLHSQKCKLEGDLVKVQKAIGDLKYFEIVGGPVPQ